MSLLNLHAGYFCFENPFLRVDRWLNNFHQSKTIRLNQRDVVVKWTRRANKAMQELELPLVIELQLYFSCVVKKRVLFHKESDFETVDLNKNIKIVFRPVISAICSPEEFARHYPEGDSLLAGVASRLVPRVVEIDFRRGAWQAEFNYC